MPQLEASTPERVTGGGTEGRDPTPFFGALVHDHLLHLAVCGAGGGRARREGRVEREDGFFYAVFMQECGHQLVDRCISALE